MSSKQWCITFVCSILIIILAIAGFNMIIDPFGVFGDKVLDWYSYNFTKNPRVAKIAYLDQHHDKFDSYLIGSSSTSSFSVDLLNKYMDANFYNIFMYGADIYDVEQTAAYVIENYEVKNIVLNLGILNAENYNYEIDALTGNLHAKTDNTSLSKFYMKYLFANPKYGLEKISHYLEDEYLQKPHDVFDIRTGAYDKSLRDVEPIQDINDYKQSYPVFTNYPHMEYNLKYADHLINSVERIKNLCEENEINLKVVFFPLYYEHSRFFNSDQVKQIYVRLAEITEFWDFSVNTITTDPRFYYDGTHFRNSLGDMALAKIFGDDTVYIPEDYGVYVTSKNAAKQAAVYETEYIFDDSSYTTEVPILMYHHLAEESSGSLIISAEQFEAHIKALSQANYTGISLQQLVDYVEKGIELPEKPIVITFDDGYSSNYEIAYPILKKYNMKATIFVIGASVGKDKYKETNHPIKPHFSYEEARTMINSELIEIQSHTYDMHQWPDYEEGTARTAVVQLEGEKEESFIQALQADFARSKKELEAGTGQQVFALAYPLGKYSSLSEVLFKEMGVKTTLTTKSGFNTVIKGLPQCLQSLKRFPVDGDLPPKELIKLLNKNP